MSRAFMAIDFERINRAALHVLPILLRRWLPDGRRRKREYLARNPTRNDRHSGSFSINVVTGKWADFADGAGGRDVVSLYAYLRGIRPGQAARELARMLRMPP
jgi:hypothetical protein